MEEAAGVRQRCMHCVPERLLKDLIHDVVSRQQAQHTCMGPKCYCCYSRPGHHPIKSIPPAALLPEEIQKQLQPLLTLWVITNPHGVIHKVESIPAALAAVGPKHGVSAKDVKLRGQHCQQQLLGEHLLQINNSNNNSNNSSQQGQRS